MRRLVAVLAVALACGAAAASASAQAPMTIAVSGAAVSRIGPFHPDAHPSLRAAIRAFGRPTSRRAQGVVCRVAWGSLGLRIVFVNLGGAAPGQTTCTPSVGKAQSFTVRSARFATPAGLTVGMPTAEVTARHPGARFRTGAWTLESAASPYGEGGRIPVLQASTSGGKVTALRGWVGAAGE